VVEESEDFDEVVDEPASAFFGSLASAFLASPESAFSFDARLPPLP
jgi:hypothetical protein